MCPLQKLFSSFLGYLLMCLRFPTRSLPTLQVRIRWGVCLQSLVKKGGGRKERPRANQ